MYSINDSNRPCFICTCIQDIENMHINYQPHDNYIPHKHAVMCQYRACTGPVLAALAQYRPVLAHNGMFNRVYCMSLHIFYDYKRKPEKLIRNFEYSNIDYT